MTASLSQPQSFPEVDPDFRRRSGDIFRKWEGGDLSYADTLKALREMMLEAEYARNIVHQGRIENLMGILNGYRANLNQSILHFEQARKYYDEAGAQQYIAACDLNLGETYRLKGNFTKARTYFRRAYETSRELGVASTQTVALANEGQLYLSMKDRRMARQILTEALTLSQMPWEDEDTNEEFTARLDIACEIHYALATLCIQEERLQEAWDHASAAYEIAQTLKYPLRLGFAHRALGDVITVLGQAPEPSLNREPDEYYRKALEYFREIKSEGEVGKTLLNQGHSLARRGKSRRAATLYQQAMVIFTKLGMTDDAARAAEAQLSVI